MQTMAEFVEQGGEFVVGKQRRIVTDRRREVTHEIGNRKLQALAGLPPYPTIAHPGATALVRPSVEVEVEACDDHAIGEHLKKLHIGVITIERGHFFHFNAVQTPRDFKEPR